MITQEIKIHTEPEPPKITVITSSTTTKSAQGNVVPFKQTGFSTGGWTYHELQKEQTRAYNLNIKVGTKWKYPNSNSWVEILGFNLAPADITSVDGSPCILRGRRMSTIDPRTDLIFNYSIDEILEMEQVND